MSESENIDLPNNLCVEEAAFEKFQVESSYEEDEFITLSDIVDPPRPTLDINACLDEIQDDVCIVSVSDPQTDQNNSSESAVETNQELLVSLPTSCDRESNSITGSSIQTVQHVSQVPPQPTPKKRGRKKKNPIPSVDVTEQFNKSSESVAPVDQCLLLEKGAEDSVIITMSDKTVCDRLSQSTSREVENSTRHTTRRRKRPLDNDIPIKSQPDIIGPDETLKPRKKRGRPKKVSTSSIQQDQSHSNQNDYAALQKPSCQADISHKKTFMEDDKIDNSKNTDKALSKLHQSSIKSVVDTKQCVDKKTPSKRGRKKKSNIHNDDLNQLESNDITNTSSTEISKQNLSVSSSKPVKGKSKNKEQDKKYDDIELQLLRMLSTPTEELEQTLNETETENKENPSRKRGRNKNKEVEEADKYSEKSLQSSHEVKQAVDSEDTDNETDDICLSSLKKRFKPENDHKDEDSSIVTAIDSIDETSDNVTELLPKRNTKKPIMSDFEYNVDTLVSESIDENVVEETVEKINSPETESPSKRPIRKKAKKVLDYDEGSDEDPFANVELSDDDDNVSGRKGGRYYSDDEYIPGKKKKGEKYSESESSLSESDELTQIEETNAKKLGKKKGRKSVETPKKNQNKKYDPTQNAIPDVTSTTADTTTQNDDELEHSLQSPDITTNENSNQKPGGAWGISHEFENFLAQKIQGTNLKIKKLTGTNSSESAIAPLEIPVIDPNEPKKTFEMSTQTYKTSTKSVEVQTTSPHESFMKCKVPLTAPQSEKACEFLKGIVKNTAELGQLMIQKSEDFIQKKINTKNVTDTNKLEYCVKKSFLLFKLAKHNLIQMEDDLANEYEQFLKSHRMSDFRESPKCITASSKQTNSDSDCEIVEEILPEQVKVKEKSKFNLKTVFLNKELSIKIAKKSSEEPQANKEKVGITGGRHTVWINDSIMVKKVKPTQSFLAQDSRNKKPPDTYISIDMVRNFFDNYYKRQKVLVTCAPLVSPVWLNVKQVGICNYFIAQTNDLSTHSRILLTPQSVTEPNIDGMTMGMKENHITQPTTLLAQCTKAVHKYMYERRPHHEKPLVAENNQQLPLKPKYQPKPLFRLSFNVVSSMLITEDKKMKRKEMKFQSISSLKKLCLRRVNTYIQEPIIISLSSAKGLSNRIEDIREIQNSRKNNVNQITNTLIKSDVKSLFSCCVESIQKNTSSSEKCDKLDITVNNISPNTNSNVNQLITTKKIKRNAKSLFSYCLDIIQKNYFTNINEKRTFNGIKTLKCIAFENVKSHMYNNFLNLDYRTDILEQMIPFAQNYTANTCCMDKEGQLLSLTIKSVNTLSDDIFAKLPDAIDEAPYSEDDNSNFSNYDEYEPEYMESNQYEDAEESNWVSRVKLQELKSCFMPTDNNSKTAIIKDSNNECVLASIKIEPLEEASENIDPSIIKTEIAENDELVFNPLATKLENSDNDAEDILRERSSSSYDVDAFEEFARTNKMLQKADYDFPNNEVFSQSALRVRKQHEPDMDDEFDTSMSLLVPQQNTDVAKDRLMKSSSDEESNTQKNTVKKKRKIRPKISRLKNIVTIPKNKSTPENEVALLTRKMQGRIRQEEKSEDSSDSEHEDTLAKLKHDKSKNQLEEKTKLKMDQKIDTEIQCNDVDSTENSNVNISKENKKVDEKTLSKTSLRKKRKENNLIDGHDSTEQDNSFVIQPDAPVELLECEPTFPMMDDDSMENIETEAPSDNIDEKSHESELQEELSYIDRHGWKCYSVNDKDTKLYEHTYILLEKLPESFVETYFRYQGVADKDQEDTDIDRLTNLQSLHRTFSKDNKARTKTNKITSNSQQKLNNTENSRAGSPTYDDNFNEFTPSEDEGANIDNEIPQALPLNATENVLAKNSLMNDMESDSEKPGRSEAEVSANKSIKKEKDEEPTSKRYRPGPKSKKDIKENDSTLLTADKMMNKELALLHAPVTLDAQDVKVQDAPKNHSPKIPTKTSSRLRAQLERVKLQDESSSEEEKQWVTTKEKLLKRLVKKQGNPSVDDAKRAKIVSEFIEKRGDAHEKRGMNRSRKPRSRKKFWERKKQMSILNRELFGENDTSYAGRTHSQAFGKGRRNIRKVIDKKSLARSTVIANMEEFERKRRLNMQQTRLREELGCEEGVNVLVINDEVCLEYDFEQMRPVVTVHPFFTKIMKAHQYEGVKFMWDACFESLSMVASGHPGGGCILAHCMGLGKTLQVLALLHTVLTHPGVGMKRVLVCCPLSTVLNWVDEINKWIGPVTNRIKVFELSKLKKTYERAYQLEDWYKDGGIFIIGYELFRSLTTLDAVLDDIKPKIVDKIRHALLNPGPDVVICDEGHLLKNDASVLAVAMSRVATKRRIVLTGTPMQNNLREYYCMVNFVKPSLLGTYAEYSNRFENPIMNGQHRDSQEEDIKLMKARTHILHKVLEGCLQRQEASVLYPYLPKKHEYTVFIPPTQCQWDLYKHYIMTYALEQQNKQQQNKQQKQSLLKDFHVLQKIWTHPQVLHNFLMKARDERNKIKDEKLEDDLAQEDLAASEDVKPNQTEVWWLQYLAGGDMLESLESSNKFVVVFQLLQEFITLGDKVLIFSTSLYTMDALEYFLKRINKWSLGQDYFRLDGSVPAEVRQKWCREFNAPHNVNTKLFLISTRAGSLGLNMTAANRVIILDTSWNPAHDIQSIFRVYRFGQKKDCFIYRLVAMGTMEQKIYERSVTKQAVSCRVVDEQQIDRHYNLAELTELYRYDEEGETVEAGFAAGVSDVALLRVAARARLHAVREHDSLLRGSREQHLPEHERNAAWMQFQQEHANNEMQDRLLEASQGIQRILEPKCAEPSGSVPVKTEIGEQSQQIVPEPGPKGRKGSKKTASNSTPPVEDPKISVQKEMQLDSEKEEAKVKKIMQLLIKHNFHTSQHAHQISQLVASVRSIVDAGGAGLESCDELTRSIATVMLQEEDIPLPSTEPPPLTDIITGDIVTSQTLNNVKQEIPHEVLDEKSDEILDGTPEEITGRTLIDGGEPSLLVAVKERRLRGRPRKYFHDEVFEPAIKRPRGRPRKNTTDTEQSSVDDDLNTPLLQRTDLGTTVSIGKKSKRLMSRTQKSYALDIDGIQILSSKEQSPEMDDAPLLVMASKQKINKRNSHIVPESDVTIVDDEDSGKEIVEPEVKKPRRAIAVKSTAKDQRSKTNYNGKLKRKAAMAAEQQIETLDSEDIVTLDDDDDWIDDSEKNKLPSPPRGLDTEKKSKNKTTRNIEKSSQNDVRSAKRRDSSILLIDDEDGSKANVHQPASEEPPSTEPEEAVPLHPSMLSNPNFIKIVAYAYQSNRMLDEDAALLAARYSTQKALKEYETTGKGITSGPLYDIAVKVLTKDVLKKLHDKKCSKRNEASLTDNIDPPRPRDTAIDTSQEVAATRDDPPQNYDPMSSDYTSQPNVVPIGMFRGSNMNQKTHEVVGECILPDDEDCILGTTDDSMPLARNVYKKRNSQQFIITSVKATAGGQTECQPASAPETIVPEMTNAVMVPAPKPKPKSRTNVTKPVPEVEPYVTITERSPLILGPNTPTFRLSTSNLNIEPTTPVFEQSTVTTDPKPQLTLTISEGKLVQPRANANNVSNMIQPNDTPSNDTICLDSDDEDVPAVNRVAQIVHLAPPLKPAGTTLASAPTPVAVTTSVKSLSLLKNNVEGVKKRINNVHPPGAPAIDTDAPTNANEHIKNQHKKIIIVPAASKVNQQKNAPAVKESAALSKLRKLLRKPSESSNRDVPQAISKKVINPEDVLGNLRTDRDNNVCKPGDLLRITKQGSMSVLSRLDKLPESVKLRLNSVPAGSSDETKSQQTVADKCKPSTSSTTARAASPRHDPLSILKDVIHIRADEYDEPKSQPANKPSHIEANKQTMTSKSQSKETRCKIKLQYPINIIPNNKSKSSVSKKTNEAVGKVKKQDIGWFTKIEAKDKKRSTQPDSIDLTNLIVNDNNAAKNSRDKSSSKSAVVVGSSKDIIIRTKPTGSTVTKASTSAANTNFKSATIKREFDSKKRMSPWPDPNSPKKKKERLFRPAQTLEDFDIDDIDDIIELE